MRNILITAAAAVILLFPLESGAGELMDYGIMFLVKASKNVSMIIDPAGNYRLIYTGKDGGLKYDNLGRADDLDGTDLKFGVNGKLKAVSGVYISYNGDGQVRAIDGRSVKRAPNGQVTGIGEVKISYNGAGQAINVSGAEKNIAVILP